MTTEPSVQLPTFDVYVSKIDGVVVVHIDTHGIPENESGPILRVYVNDGEAVYANPERP